MNRGKHPSKLEGAVDKSATPAGDTGFTVRKQNVETDCKAS